MISGSYNNVIITRPRDKRGVYGFSLLEISVVLLIIALIMGAAITTLTLSLSKKQYDETRMKLAAIQKALLDYRRTYNRLPCPGDLTLAPSNANFGVEAANRRTCDGTPAANFSYDPADFTTSPSPSINTQDGSPVIKLSSTSGVFVGSSATVTSSSIWVRAISTNNTAVMWDNTNNVDASSTTSALTTFTFDYKIVAGMIPTRTLRLPDDYALDGWGRRIVYALDSSFTVADAFTSIPVTDATTRLTVTFTGGSTNTRAAYALISYGPNGHGAYPREGGTTRIGSASTNVNELVNCQCVAATGASNVAADYRTLVQQEYTVADTTDPTDVFDDLLVYATRQDLRAVNE